MQTLQLDEFLRSIKQNIDTPHSLLLGAGASIESGIPSAADCIWDWKREIYLSKNPGAIGNFDNSKSEGVRRVIQRWIDAQNIYPAENSADEYSYFAEKAYPIADDRRKYFQHLVANHNPSLGYHLISLLALENIIKSVWMLAPGENRHFEPGENSQLWPDRNRQYVPGGCSQPRFGCRF